MRKITLLFLLFSVLFVNSTLAQITGNFNYQAVIRDAAGELITDQNINVQVTIIESTIDGTEIYSEEHTVTTSGSGQINLMVGNGTASLGTFESIDWSSIPKFIKIEIDTGSGFIEMGTFQLFSVPYAHYAFDVENKDDADADATNEIQDISLSGTDLSITSGSTVDLSVIQDGVNDADADATNEIQDLDLTSNILTITNNPSPTQINLAPFQGTNTDEQVLSLDGTDLSISGGNTIDVSSLQDGVDDADANPTNEIQDISLSGTNLSITSGSTVDLSVLQDGVNDADNNPGNELQTLSLDGDTLQISDGNKIVFPYDSSQWAVNGDKLYYNTGNVGIGSSNPVSNLEVKANSAGTDALFQVINANNDTVFAVYPDGVKIFIDESAKGKVGGFAVSGRNPAKAGGVDIMKVTLDSTRIYVSDTVSSKGKVGGFAVSGRNPSKGIAYDYLVVTGDSTRIYVNDTVSAKGKVGGFAVSGRNPSKGGTNEYLQVTRDSTRIYISEPGSKGKVGGFAVSGRNPSKGFGQDYFNISANTLAEKINNESRVMWYPEKSALLAGEVHVGDADSVGTNSIAIGYRNIAKGNWSQAFGFRSKALGTYSTAIGNEAEADTNSLAVGYQAKALGNDAYALGSGALAIGNKSFAFGSVGIDSAGVVTGSTQATGEYSFAFGLGAEASDTGAFAMGSNVTASGFFSTALGYYTTSSNLFSTSMGAHTESTGLFSTAMGYFSKASGAGASAIGRNVEAAGAQSVVMGTGSVSDLNAPNSVVLGYESEALAAYSVAIGWGNIGSGTGGVAIGVQDTAKGTYSTAVGYQSSANGLASFASGRETVAGGLYSTATGYQSLASGNYSTAMGRGGTASGMDAMSLGYNTTASGNSSFAMGYQTTAESFLSLVIGQWNTTGGQNASSWSASDYLFVAGNGTGSGTRGNALTLLKSGDLEIAGDLTADGTTYTSDKRLKDNINDIKYGLNDVLQLRPVSFNWKDNPGGSIRLGLIAQEVQPVIKEVVETKNDEQQTLGIRYTELIPVLIKSIQEQQSIIEEQKKKNEELENQLKLVLERLERLESK